MTGLDLLVAAHNAPPATGGIERWVDDLCRHLAPGRAALLRPPTADHDSPADGAYHVLTAPLVGTCPPRWRPARRALLDAPASAVTLCAEWWPHARALAGAERPGVRAVLVHGTEVLRSLHHPRAQRSLVRALGGMDVVVANSTYTADLCARLDVEAVVLPPGIDLDRPHGDPVELAARLDLDGRPVVASISRLVPRKGHRELLDRWRRVLDAVPDAIWVVAGDGPERAALEALAPPSVRVLGAVDDPTVGALLRLADVHVMPGIAVDGHVEGFGLVAVEAAACGTPTVATDVGGVGDAVGAGGIVVADHDALVDAVTELLRDGVHRRELGERARTQAAALAWPELATRYREALHLEGVPA
ncbi:glycosyltransferase family 4 protein [Acidimicrobiia bacterium EGI L10123]|uniref:glycosyltransferase family 4 protein n=1 Tax=Salinilacustrithrix flava TaxID=2957203 RepID=UPI003D7C33B8|nr:glycosyltransferase family 4 protein [Acidimicrobiia bacterium EGI L10123]